MSKRAIPLVIVTGLLFASLVQVIEIWDAPFFLPEKLEAGLNGLGRHIEAVGTIADGDEIFRLLIAACILVAPGVLTLAFKGLATYRTRRR